MYSAIALLIPTVLAVNSHSSNPVKKSNNVAVTVYPQHYFSLPLGIPTRIRAGFAAFREDHFHSGIDLSTNGREGVPVLAAAAGYVSRIKVQAGGYGQALYITHPNGYVTVYGHLQKYAGQIASYLSSVQQANRTYELDIYPKPGELPVTNQMLVAFSGDTGYSGGPHLHFEIRDEKTEEIINPLLFGLPFTCSMSPTIKGVELFGFSIENYVSRVVPLGYYPACQVSPGNYVLVSSVSAFEGQLVAGIVCNDASSAKSGKCGIYQVTLLRDSSVIFKTVFERFAFDKTRSINSYLDYTLARRHIFVQRSYHEPGNDVSLYKSPGNGVFMLSAKNALKMRYEVSDVFGNRSTLTFTIGCRGPAIPTALGIPSSKTFLIRYDKDFTYSIRDQITVYFPSHCLFDNKELSVNINQRSIEIGDLNIPVKDSIRLTIPVPSRSDKWVLKQATGSPVPGFVSGGTLTAWIKSFGVYTLDCDSTPPHITKIGLLSFRVTDTGSGIKKYAGSMDGNWVMFRYDQKKNLIWYKPEKQLVVNKHSLRLSVTDKAGNTNTVLTSFTY